MPATRLHASGHLAAAGLAAVLLCTGCTAGPAMPAGPAPSPTAAGTPATHSAGDNPQAPPTRTPIPNPTWGPVDRQTARATAMAAMKDFARPDADPREWANDFARWLTPQATSDYSAVDPANIPVRSVTGEAVLHTDPGNGFGTEATVPTDIGDYTVQLLRQDQDAPWKVHRLIPPKP